MTKTWGTVEELANRLSICAVHAKDSPDNWTHLNPVAREHLLAAAAELRRLTDENNLLTAAIGFAHEQGFEWPADPLAFVSQK